MPSAIHAEAGVLASFFQDKLAIAIARERFSLNVEDFFLADNRTICSAIYEEFDKGRAVDVITICGNLQRHSQLEELGGQAKIQKIAEAEADLTHVENYVEDIKNAATKRFAFARAGELSRKSLNGVSAVEITAFFEEAARELAQKTADMGAAGRTRFNLIPIEEFEKRPRPSFLVDDLLVEGGLASIEGKAESYKSFIAVALAASIATGLPWCGREVKQGGVVYISGEGSSGLINRFKVWQTDAQTKLPPDFFVLPEAVQMMDYVARGEVDQLISDIKFSGASPSLIVIDTLARCMVGGDENSAQDMGKFVKGADKIRQAFNCGVLIVHHQGNNGKVRGSSAFMGAMDTRLEVERHKDEVTIKCGKQKDFDHFEDFGLARRIISIGNTGDSSLVFDLTSAIGAAQPMDMSEKLGAALDVLRRSEKALKSVEWEKLALTVGIARATFYRCRERLIEQGHVKKHGFLYMVPEAEHPVLGLVD